MPDTVSNPLPVQNPGKLSIAALLRPHWNALCIALIAVFGETLSDILQPWPIKIVIDNLLQSKKLPHWLGGFVTHFFGE